MRFLPLLGRPSSPAPWGKSERSREGTGREEDADSFPGSYSPSPAIKEDWQDRDTLL